MPEELSISLRDYVDSKFEDIKSLIRELERHVDNKFTAKDQIIDRTEKSLNERLLQMNEFRQQITSERLLYVNRDQLEVAVKNLESKIDMLLKTFTGDIRPLQAKQTFNSGAMWALGIFVTVVSTAISYVIAYLKK